MNIASILVGGAAWIALGLPFASGVFFLDWIETLFLLAPLVIVPLGIGLLPALSGPMRRGPFLKAAERLQPFAALLVLASFALDKGAAAGALALPWAAVCGLLGLEGLRDLPRAGWKDPTAWAFLAGFFFIPVGGAWLVLSRFGLNPAGFSEPIILLTAVHFHFTGFAASLIAAAMGRVIVERSGAEARLYRIAVAGLLLGTPLLAAGFVFSPALKVFAAFTLASGLSLFAVLALRAALALPSPGARAFLIPACLSVLAAMALAGLYSVGEFRERLILTIPDMARTHGTLNALGFSLCGLIGCRLALGAHDGR